MTGANILVTGAAGYIGGSVVADFLASKNEQLVKARIHAAVRTQEQADAWSKLGANVLRLDLSDADAVTAAILSNNSNCFLEIVEVISDVAS